MQEAAPVRADAASLRLRTFAGATPGATRKAGATGSGRPGGESRAAMGGVWEPSSGKRSAPRLAAKTGERVRPVRGEHQPRVGRKRSPLDLHVQLVRPADGTREHPAQIRLRAREVRLDAFGSDVV